MFKTQYHPKLGRVVKTKIIVLLVIKSRLFLLKIKLKKQEIMKRTFAIALILIVVVISLNSCRSNRGFCPAYGKAGIELKK
jgi:hypothetical protein